MRANKTRKMTTAVALTAVAVTGIGVAAPASAGATPAASVDVATTKITADQWRQVAARAAAAGDIVAADAATAMAVRADGGATTQGVGGVVKAAIKSLLKYGRNYLPASIRPYADKILDALEALDNWVEGPIVSALVAAGVPFDVAQVAAQWIVTFAV